MTETRETYCTIPVTQHIRPNNFLDKGTLRIAEHGLEAATSLIDLGYSFHAEVILGRVNITVEYYEGHVKAGEEDLASAIIHNDERLLNELADFANETWKKVQPNGDFEVSRMD